MPATALLCKRLHSLIILMQRMCVCRVWALASCSATSKMLEDAGRVRSLVVRAARSIKTFAYIHTLVCVCVCTHACLRVCNSVSSVGVRVRQGDVQ